MSVKVEYNRGVMVNVSLVDPLINYFRTGGSDGFFTDTVFIKLSKYGEHRERSDENKIYKTKFTRIDINRRKR